MEPRKILAVDDSRLMLKMYEVMLRRFPLVFASDGREALQRLDEHGDVDLVLLDVNMPNMNGIELLGALRASGRLDRLTVIIVSTDGKQEDTARGLEAGATAYITKPFGTDQVLNLIAGLEKGASA